MGQYELSASQWQRIEDFLPGRPGHVGVTAKDNRSFVNGVLWVLRSGAQWKYLPEEYGNWRSVHKRFTRWAKSGIWQRIFEVLLEDVKGVGKTCQWGGVKLYHLGVIGQHKCPHQLFERSVPEIGWPQA